MKKIDVRVQEIMKALNVDANTAAQMAIAEYSAMAGTPEVANAEATDTPAPAKAKAPKFFAKAKKEVVVEYDGLICKLSYAGGDVPAGVDAYAKDVDSAIKHINKIRILEEFGDDVKYVKKSSKWVFECTSTAVRNKLVKFEIQQGISKKEWNAWCDYKADYFMKEAQGYENKKAK